MRAGWLVDEDRGEEFCHVWILERTKLLNVSGCAIFLFAPCNNIGHAIKSIPGQSLDQHQSS